MDGAEVLAAALREPVPGPDGGGLRPVDGGLGHRAAGQHRELRRRPGGVGGLPLPGRRAAAGLAHRRDAPGAGGIGRHGAAERAPQPHQRPDRRLRGRLRGTAHPPGAAAETARGGPAPRSTWQDDGDPTSEVAAVEPRTPRSAKAEPMPPKARPPTATRVHQRLRAGASPAPCNPGAQSRRGPPAPKRRHPGPPPPRHPRRPRLPPPKRHPVPPPLQAPVPRLPTPAPTPAAPSCICAGPHRTRVHNCVGPHRPRTPAHPGPRPHPPTPAPTAPASTPASAPTAPAPRSTQRPRRTRSHATAGPHRTRSHTTAGPHRTRVRPGPPRPAVRSTHPGRRRPNWARPHHLGSSASARSRFVATAQWADSHGLAGAEPRSTRIVPDCRATCPTHQPSGPHIGAGISDPGATGAVPAATFYRPTDHASGGYRRRGRRNRRRHLHQRRLQSRARRRRPHPRSRPHLSRPRPRRQRPVRTDRRVGPTQRRRLPERRFRALFWSSATSPGPPATPAPMVPRRRIATTALRRTRGPPEPRRPGPRRSRRRRDGDACPAREVVSEVTASVHGKVLCAASTGRRVAERYCDLHKRWGYSSVG